MKYLTVAKETRNTTEVNRSVFICTVGHIETYEEGIDFVKRITKEYSDATHNCYAFRLYKGEQKFNDDGEPSGTAGQPILQAIKGRELYDTVAVVTRYFGGIKLGTGGLVAAYGGSTSSALTNAETKEMTMSSVCEAECDYTEYVAISSYIRQSKYLVLDAQYAENVKVAFALPVEETATAVDKITELTQGRRTLKTLRTEFVDLQQI